MGTMDVCEIAHLARYRMGEFDWSSDEEIKENEPRLLLNAHYDGYDEFKEAQEARKYLFDGKNMIRIKPSKIFKKKAIMGKVSSMRDNLLAKLDSTKITAIEMIEGKFNGDLDDYIPAGSYLGIPEVLYYPTREIERRLPYEKRFVYMPRCDLAVREQLKREIQKLKKKFLKGNWPNMWKIEDIDVLTGVVLSFLGDLRDKVIPTANREEFQAVANLRTMEERVAKLIDLVAMLPRKNQATLGYIVQHMKRVASSQLRMPIKGLAAVFGPPTIGFSEANEARERALTIETMHAMAVMPLHYFGANFYGCE